MKNLLKTSFLFVAFAAVALVACNNEEQISKPINGDRTASAVERSDADASANTDDREARAEEARKRREEQLAKERQESKSASLPATNISFREYEWDFGVINEGDNVEHVFQFTNTGTEPLILENCKGSCGCTVPQCPKNPIPPGGSGDIKVVFNSKGKKNMQTKRVTIMANTDPLETVLTIKANVTPES